jgi:hypothetical protein
MASGVFSFSIGLHTFATIIFGYRLSNKVFLALCVLLWFIIYGLAIGGIHHDTYVRAIAWCWVNPKYPGIRLWLHYFWIYCFEFGTVLVYTVMIFAVHARVQTDFYQSTEHAKRAKEAARLMIAYPIIYVVCTLPLATLRMVTTINSKHVPDTKWFCFAGAMITSNGWLDVLLYTLTRRILLFSDEPPADNGIETFSTLWSKAPIFGTETVCEHVPNMPLGKQPHLQVSTSKRSSETELEFVASNHNRIRGSKSRSDSVSIMEKTTVEVKSEIMNSHERRELRKNNNQATYAVPGLAASRVPNASDHDNDGASSSSTRRLWQGANDSDYLAPLSNFSQKSNQPNGGEL